MILRDLTFAVLLLYTLIGSILAAAFHCRATGERTWLVAATVGLAIALSGCARIASGPYGTTLDAMGRPSAAEAKATKLLVSAGEKENMSSTYFGEIEVTFENPTSNWIRVEKIALDFGSETNNRSVVFPWGSRLESWATSTGQRNAIRSANNALALELLALGSVVARSGASPHAHTPNAAGGFASLAAMTALVAGGMQARAESAESVPTFEGSHLFALPFDVPPGLFVKRWLVVNTPGEETPGLGCLSTVIMTYELSDKTSHHVALAFRYSYDRAGQSPWQQTLCTPPGSRYDR